MKVGVLNDAEIEFLRTQGMSAADVYDGRSQKMKAWQLAARAAGATLVLGTPCAAAGHRLRSRYGHCVQCDTKKIAYQNRHKSPGFIYIAASKKAGLIKIGTAVDIDQRERNLRNHRYGSTDDWTILFYAHVNNGGDVERSIIQKLKGQARTVTYEKDGNRQEASELFDTQFSKALATAFNVLKTVQFEREWLSPIWKQFER